MSQLNLIGTTLGRFEILSELGRGGMAVVYKARQTDLDRIVAFKILPPEMTHDTSYVARFRQEARSAARLEHPHIMPIYEVGEASGLHYIAMKFIQGRTLKELVQQSGALTVRRAAEILAQIGDALDYAHRQGVIHRDIKPSNIMITDEGWAYLTDFGLARGTDGASAGLTMAGTVMGTPEYMSPEQAQGLPSVGTPTDIYALGVVLYELLTGTFPFQAETPMAMLAARLLQAPIPPRDVRGDLPPAVEDVIMRALARKPEARFASAAEMVAALRAAAGIGTATHAQRPVTPLGGMPAVGETIVAGVGTPQRGVQPPTPPYVQPVGTPQRGVQPPQAQVAATMTTPQWSGPPAQSQPPGLPPLPTLPATPAGAQMPPAAPPAKSRAGLFIGIGAAALVLLIAVVGGLALLSRPAPTPDPDPQPAPTTAQAVEFIQAGDAALASGEIDSAIESYRQALAESAGNTAALSGIALAHNLRGDWLQAEQSANELVNAALADDTAAALGLALLADAIASQGGIAEAGEPIQQALELDDGLALAHAIRSNLMASQAADLQDTAAMDEALAAADTAVDSLPDESSVVQALTYNAIAVTFHRDYDLTGNQVSLTESEADYQQAIELLPNSALFHSNLGYLYSATERYDEARDAFEQALEHDPAYAQAQLGIGWLHYDQGEIEQAAAAFDEAIQLQPGEADAYFARGRLAYDDGDYDTAVEQFNNAIRRNPRYAAAHAWLGEAHLFRGFGRDEGGEKDQDYAQAAEAFRAALAINPNYVIAASGLGWILQYQEEYEESVAQFEAALRIDPNNDEAHNGLGWSLFNRGQYAEAEAAFRRAVELAPDYASPHYGLGRALEELGRRDEARTLFLQTLEIDPDYSEAQEALDRVSE